MRRLLLALLVTAPAVAPDAGAPSATGTTGTSTPRWWRANFHAHSANTPDALADDGSEPVAALHAAVARHGFHFSLHSPHSADNTDAAAPAHFDRQRAIEAALAVDDPARPFVVSVGEELTVKPGPRFQRRSLMFGRDAPGNLDHVTLVGADGFVPSETPLGEACRRAHRAGGLCLVNHPGPGPMMWEPDLWESPATRHLVDGLEVYNGQALASVGVDFESRYLEASSYRGLGAHLAATTGADTHGPGSTARARSSLDRFGTAARLLAAMAPGPSPVGDGRPELDAATWVLAPTPRLADVIAAVKARRTIATYRFDGAAIECPGLGEVRATRDVKLRLALGRPVDRVTLYREGEPAKTWTSVADVEFAETIAKPTAYVFVAREGAGRLLTSAIWYEPPSRK